MAATGPQVLRRRKTKTRGAKEGDNEREEEKEGEDNEGNRAHRIQQQLRTAAIPI